MAYAADVATLRAIVGATGSSTPDEVLANDLEVATELVSEYVGSIEIPAVVVTEAVLAVAAERFNQRKAPNGVLMTAFTNSDGSTATRISRDPMTPAYPLLAQWLSGKGYVA